MSERIWKFLAWHAPERWVYFCALRAVVNASQGQWSNQEVPTITAMDVLQRWSGRAQR